MKREVPKRGIKVKKVKVPQAQVVRKESVAGRRSEKGQGTMRKSEKGDIPQ